MTIRRLLLASIGLIIASPTMAEAPFVEKSFEEACAEAKKAEKLVLIDFYTTWCGPCKKLDRETWPDKDVKALLADKFIAIKLDAEKDTKTAGQYKINVYPTILITKSNGDEVDRLTGFKPPDDLVDDLKDALAGKDSVTRAREQADKQKGDPSARMHLGDALAEKGNHAGALEEYLWCFDHGNENSAGFYGVRLSFLLGKITRLGQQYPPALEALRERRDAAAEAVRQSTGGNSEKTTKPRAKKSSFWSGLLGGESHRDSTFEKAHDFAAINRELGENRTTLALYDEVREKKGVNAGALDLLFKEVIDELLKLRRYNDIANGAGDVKAQINQEIQSFKMMETYFKNANMPEEMINGQRRQVVTKGAKYYEAFLGARQIDKANGVADQLLKFDPSGNSYETLVRAALRAKAKHDAGPLVARARKELKPAELKRIQPTLDRIPSDD